MAKPQASKAGDLGLIPGQGSRSCVPTVKDPECHKEEPTLGNEDLARSNLNLAQPHTHTHTHTHTRTHTRTHTQNCGTFKKK